MSIEWSEREENIEALRERIAAPLLGAIPYLPEFSVEKIADALDIDCLLRAQENGED